MTDYGESATGWRGKTFDEVVTSLKGRLRERIDQNLTLDELDWLGNAVDVTSDEAALVWEALEVARNQFDPDNAEGAAAVSLAALTGTKRNDPTNGRVLCSLGLDANATFAPGALVAHVSGQPSNRWVNLETVASTTAGTYTGIVFVSETAGRYLALANTLKIIAQTKSGWNSVTNPADATPGTDLESIPDLMVRREEEIAGGGSSTYAAIQKQVGNVTGVIQCKVFYNDTTATFGVLPPNSLRVVVWDGSSPAASNDEIAQAIWDKKSAGSPTIGGTNAFTGTATDVYGDTHTMNAARATSTTCYASITVQAPIGTSTVTLTADLKESILEQWPVAIGKSAYVNKLILGPAALESVINVTAFTIGTSPGPVGSSITPASDAILLLDSANIAVTINLI